MNDCSPANTVYGGASSLLCEPHGGLPYTGFPLLLVAILGVLFIVAGMIVAHYTTVKWTIPAQDLRDRFRARRDR